MYVRTVQKSSTMNVRPGIWVLGNTTFASDLVLIDTARSSNLPVFYYYATRIVHSFNGLGWRLKPVSASARSFLVYHPSKARYTIQCVGFRTIFVLATILLVPEVQREDNERRCGIRWQWLSARIFTMESAHRFLHSVFVLGFLIEKTCTTNTIIKLKIKIELCCSVRRRAVEQTTWSHDVSLVHVLRSTIQIGYHTKPRPAHLTIDICAEKRGLIPRSAIDSLSPA